MFVEHANGKQWSTLHLRLPSVDRDPSGRPRACPRCGCIGLTVHQACRKSLADLELRAVASIRYQCKKCLSTHRHYPSGVGAGRQSQRLRALSVLLYALGLTYDEVHRSLTLLGCPMSKGQIWLNVDRSGSQARVLHRRWRHLSLSLTAGNLPLHWGTNNNLHLVVTGDIKWPEAIRLIVPDQELKELREPVACLGVEARTAPAPAIPIDDALS